jgi:DNA-binding NarL/FixJ family response regulator
MAEGLSEITLLLVRRMAAAGAKSGFISKKLGVSERQVNYATGRQLPDDDTPPACAKLQDSGYVLTERQLMILELHINGDWSLRAIARGIGCAPSSVHNSYHLALKRLAEYMSECACQGPGTAWDDSGDL